MRPRILAYLVAVLAALAAVSLRAVLEPWLGSRVPYVTLFGAVIVAAWYGGAGPAIVAAFAGWLGVRVAIGPAASGTAGQAIETAAYALSTLLIAGLGGAMLRARRLAEENGARLSSFLQNSPNGVFLKDEDGRYVFMNRAAERLTGRTDWQGRTDQELVPAAAREIQQHDRAVLESGEAREYDLRFESATGVRELHSVKFPLGDKQGRRYVGSITMDVTEERRTGRAFGDARETLQTVADAMPAVVTLCSRDLRFVWINELGAQWLRRRPEEVIGRPMAEVIGEAALAQIRPYIERVLRGEEVSYEREVEYPAIGRRWASVRFAPARNGTWVSVITDIHERKRMEEALRETDRRKDEFLATLAHELRNPLAPIRNAVALLGRAEAPEADRAWSRGVIERQVALMVRLIDDLLDLARVSSGKLFLQRRRVRLAEVVALALETSRPHIEEAGHRLSVTLPSSDVTLDADPARIAQVLSNLLNNAAKYTPAGGSITVRAEEAGGEAAIAVSDDGLGFPPELAERLFEPFTQWAAEGRTTGGLGIGLSLVRGIVSLHGGRVTAKSAGPGHGSTFEVQLPLAAGPDDAQGAQSSTPAAGTGDGRRVLLADDNRDAADSLARLLALNGYDVRVAYDGAAALDLCAQFLPQVAVLDIGMPGASGYEVARELRRRYGARLRLIALTGWGQEGDVERAREAGFDRHLTKPVDPAELNVILRQCS